MGVLIKIPNVGAIGIILPNMVWIPYHSPGTHPSGLPFNKQAPWEVPGEAGGKLWSPFLSSPSARFYESGRQCSKPEAPSTIAVHKGVCIIGEVLSWGPYMTDSIIWGLY